MIVRERGGVHTRFGQNSMSRFGETPKEGGYQFFSHKSEKILCINISKWPQKYIKHIKQYTLMQII